MKCNTTSAFFRVNRSLTSRALNSELVVLIVIRNYLSSIFLSLEGGGGGGGADDKFVILVVKMVHGRCLCLASVSACFSQPSCRIPFT